MDSFEEWAKGPDHQHASVQKYADQLIELGASWDTFRRSPDSIVQDLVAGGIPLLAARDIVDVASDTIRRGKAPMAIFWDLENMPIPTTSSGRDVASRLKSVLSPHGDLVHFRGYGSIGTGLIPEDKRSDLQLSGCHLVDCPHSGRKEVADKMIIVDAMQFAFTHPEGATLCFVTGDVDYAYLLAVLQRPQWRTVVISKGTMQSMLHVNCDMKIRWETDILQFPASNDTEDEPTVSGNRPLSRDEQWSDDVELLRTVLKNLMADPRNVSPNYAYKARVFQELRRTNPVRFYSSDVVRAFLQRAREKGVVVEVGSREKVMLGLPDEFDTQATRFRQIPDSSNNHDTGDGFALLHRVIHQNVYEENEDGTIVARKATIGGMLRKASPERFGTREDIQEYLLQAIESGAVKETGSGAFKMLILSSTHTIKCSRCETRNRDGSGMLRDPQDPRHMYCFSCHEWKDGEKENIVRMVTNMLENVAAESDHYFLREKVSRDLLRSWYSEKCTSDKLASFWLATAKAEDAITYFRRSGSNTELICLPKHLDIANQPFPSQSTDYSNEIYFLVGLIRNNSGWIDRKTAIQGLKDNFASCDTPFARNVVFKRGEDLGRFIVWKRYYGHVVAFSKASAMEGFSVAFKDIGTKSVASDDINDDPDPDDRDFLMLDADEEDDGGDGNADCDDDLHEDEGSRRI